MATTILIKHLVRKDPRLGRRVHHDSRSLAFPFKTEGLTIQSVVWNRNIPILDQGQIGCCTANAGIGLLGTDPFFKTLPANPKYSLDESGALILYNDEEVYDGDGTYPPNDEGSSGITCATCLQAANLVSGYTHTFTTDDALKAISKSPALIGINWYNSMFTTAADGKIIVDTTSGIAGGHELLAREIDAPNERLWLDNSWSVNGFGIQGRGYLSFEDLNTLLGEDGDMTFPTPLSQPAPQPIQTKKETLLAEFEGWLDKHF